MMVKDNNLASPIAEPGVRPAIKPIRAIWLIRSPNWEMIWADHRHRKSLFFLSPRKRFIAGQPPSRRNPLYHLSGDFAYLGIDENLFKSLRILEASSGEPC